MNKFFTTLFLGTAIGIAHAQTPAPTTQPYGKIDQADLDMKACDFEKDANAEVLFNKGDLYYDGQLREITMEVHKRIKIFNDHGKKSADIHLEYISQDHLEYINSLQAETINLIDGKQEITKLDKTQIFTKAIDKVHSELTFTMPNVKPGCVIEFKYKWNTVDIFDLPDWDFQENIPVKYSEFDTSIPDLFYFRQQSSVTLPYAKHSSKTDSRSYTVPGTSETYPYNIENETRGIANIPALPDEPYMSSFQDNVQRLQFQLVSFKQLNGFARSHSDTWAKVGGILADDEDFGGQLKRKLNNEEAITVKAKALKTDEEKIAYIFGEVKNAMKWNGIDRWYTNDGTYRAWENKTGNSAEINLILYHLLKQSGVNAYPMVVSTRENGRVRPYYTSTSQFNRAVVYVRLDSARRYVLDATGKYNIYNVTPAELLNSSGLWIDKSKNIYDKLYIQKDEPVRQVVLINADIKAGGKLEGTAQISSSSYNRISALQKYKSDGETKYINYLSDNDNNLKISSLKFENMEVDTLPLTQNIAFNLDLAGSDDNYIYLNPNLFTGLKTNPFLSENRMTDVDFGYMQNFAINGIYKIPAGYKTDALPKSVSIVMPDKSIVFNRFVAEQDGSIVVRYKINYTKSSYDKADYPDFREFFKKMHEMLNEQIILKKG